jgi:voltage-gated potassium channel
LRFLTGALATVVATGTVGYHYIEGWSYFDGFYMVVTTLTTVGYGEVHPLDFAGRLFTVFVLISGVTLLLLTIGGLTQALLESELQSFFGRRRMERQISRLSGHYILCGAGRVGRSVARELDAKGAPFVLIDQNEAKFAQCGPDWLTLPGDATKEETLHQARIEHALGLVAAATTDATNLYVVLTARTLNPKLRIIARASEEDSAKHLRTAGADSVVSPYHFAGQRIAYTFLRPNVINFLDSAIVNLGMDLEIDEFVVSGGSRLAGQALGTSGIRQQSGVIILAIKRGGVMQFNPEPEDRIEAGDFLIAMGQTEGLKMLAQSASGAA